jgi:hypothetical protein
MVHDLADARRLAAHHRDPVAEQDGLLDVVGQNFFVATPGIAPLSGSSAPTGTVPASPSSPAAGGYGY